MGREREDLRKQTLRWALLFLAVFGALVFALWWSGSALHFSASRMQAKTSATYRLFGRIRDAGTGAPLPFARIEDDPAGRPPLSQSMADVHGAYVHLTVAEPHLVRVTSIGYKPAQVRVGRPWYLWMPSDSQQLDISLEPER